MTIEALPHYRRTVYPGTREYIERSPDYQEDLDPYGEVPVETEDLKPEVAELRTFFLTDRQDESWGIGIPSPEGMVDISAGRDTNGRKALMVEISFSQPKVEENEPLRLQTQRYLLYPNNIATYRFLESSFKGFRDEHGEKVHIEEENTTSQGFITERSHLQSLKCARMIFEGK